jgi:nicotinamidase-related amidase
MKTRSNFTRNLAVILIDMQEHFIQNNPEKLAIVPSQIAVLRFLRAKGVPAFIVTGECYGALEPNLEREVQQFPLDQVHHLIKPYDSAFTCCEFNPLLQRRNVKKLFLMGINAGFCVYSTAVGALRLGYKVATAPWV